LNSLMILIFIEENFIKYASQATDINRQGQF
jgi:hypothetical protein